MIVDVCLIVPPGAHDVGPLAVAIRDQRRDARISAVWGGDPHRRPPLVEGVRWSDLRFEESSGAGWGRLLAALPSDVYGWARASRVCAAEIRRGARSVLILRVGWVGVVGALTDWWPESGVAAIERTSEALPLDGLAPTPADLVNRGQWSAGVLGVAADAVPVLDEIGDLATGSGPNGRIEPIVEVALAHAHALVSTPGSGLAVGWRHATQPIGVVDISDVKPAAPWCVDFDGARPRHLLSADATAAAGVAMALPQVVGTKASVTLPGGIAVDRSIRTLMSDAIAAWRRGDGDLPPDPYTSNGFVDWLQAPSARSGGAIGRYWFEEWASRPDLHVVFPDPIGEDRARFQSWAHDSWQSDGRSARLRALDVRETNAVERWTDLARSTGVNVIGYIAADSGLGDFTRRVYRSLDRAGVPVSGLHYGRTASPRASDVVPLTTELHHDVNLITVHGDQMRYFADDHGAEVFPGRRNIGYWFWELSELTPRLVESIDLVDEIWVATEFIADAYRRVTDKPVRVVPIPVPEPVRSTATHSDMGLPDDRYVFLVTLDHLSITDRKNPIAAIKAFELAFPEPASNGPVLVVKTLNGSHRWSEHEQLQLAAAGRADIHVVDRHVTREDQMRLIELSDCLVSLHRSEGLGLHLLEAMWLETPVIATRYSGNLDVMTDENSVLIDAELVPVTDQQGYYPTSAVWAEPSLDQAATEMRRMFEDADAALDIAQRARNDMVNQPSLTHTGHLISRLCRGAVVGTED